MIEIIIGWVVNYGLQVAGGTIGAAIVGWILAKIPTGKWAESLAKLGEKNGLAVSQFCRKKVPLWEKVVEPVFIDTIKVIPAYIAGFIVGLKKDND